MRYAQVEKVRQCISVTCNNVFIRRQLLKVKSPGLFLMAGSEPIIIHPVQCGRLIELNTNLDNTSKQTFKFVS